MEFLTEIKILLISILVCYTIKKYSFWATASLINLTGSRFIKDVFL